MMRDTIVESFAHSNGRSWSMRFLTDLHTLLTQYIRALVLLAMSTFMFYSIFLGITDGPFRSCLQAWRRCSNLYPRWGLWRARLS